MDGDSNQYYGPGEREIVVAILSFLVAISTGSKEHLKAPAKKWIQRFEKVLEDMDDTSPQ